MRPTPNFRVIIAGASVAGLTLAHCLLKNNIDFIVLEANPEIAPEVGASIGLFANGARILDQLGVYDDIQEEIVPLENGYFWAADGSLMLKSDYPEDLHRRHGYPVAFLQRRKLLKILFKHLGVQIFSHRRVVLIITLRGRVMNWNGCQTSLWQRD